LDEWISPSSFDVYVLTETSEGSGTQLITSEFKTAGWTIFQRPTIAKDRGVTIASRLGATESTHYSPSDPAPGRSIVIDLHTSPRVQLVGMYVPNRGNDPTKTERKRTFLEDWLRFLSDDSSSTQRILLGDLNVVPPAQRPQFLPQQQFEYDWYANLNSRGGFYDAAVMHSASGHESTWVAHTGEGYTYDHILLQKALSPRVVKFEYDHSTRSPGGITDHSALILSLDVDTASIVHRRPLAVPTQAELFSF
jgi:exodeoxyribonuclease-3